MRVRSEVVALRDLPAGAPVGYGATFVTTRPTRVATVPVGYADGFSRALSNRGSLLVRGKRAPVIGTVSMDMTMLDVTEIDEVRVGRRMRHPRRAKRHPRAKTKSKPKKSPRHPRHHPLGSPDRHLSPRPPLLPRVPSRTNARLPLRPLRFSPPPSATSAAQRLVPLLFTG